MLRHDQTWLSIRVQDGVVQAKVFASTVDDNNTSASESFGVFLAPEVETALLNVLESNSNEAVQRALETGFSTARAQRLELGGAMGAIGAVGN